MIQAKPFSTVYSKIIKILLAIILLFPLTSFSQSIIYVDHDAGGSNNGTSWTDAYITLYSALTNASAEDTIWVAEGTYYPDDASGRYSTLQMIKEVAIYGGFDGTESNLNQRDYKNNITILSGDIGVIDDATDNSYHVVTGIDTARIDGFTIQKGYADGPDYLSNSGGAIFNFTFGADLEDLVIANCTFKDNKAKAFGGAIHNYDAKELLISNCTFEDNSYVPSQDLAGGAIGTYYSQVDITNCSFTDNLSRLNGGAIYNDHSTVSISNSYFSGNQTTNGRGGAIANYLCMPAIGNSVFSENYSSQYGGAIYNVVPAGPVPEKITNCTFYLNIGGSNGGAIADDDNSSESVNCIFLANDCSGQNKSVHNITGNNLPNVTYSRVQESIAGTGNIQVDPKFVNDASDWHLQAGSPCIDAANGDDAPATDKEDNPRHDDFGADNSGTGTPSYADMGAYEFQGNSPMNGTYTIGVTGNFISFTEAIDSLISLGVDDAVVFNIESGTYTEQVVIPEITGTSETNTIIFQSATGDSTDVILTYAASDENFNYTLKVDGADFISIKNISLKATGTTYARVVEIDNESTNNQYANNRFIGVSNKSELVYSYNSADSSNVFTQNVFQAGKTGIQMTGSLTNHLTIEHNEFWHQSDTSIFIKYYNYTEITSNLIYSDNKITGILLDNNREHVTIEQNQIYLPNGGYGLHLYSVRLAGTDTSRIFNNHIYINTTEPDKGIFIQEPFASNIKIYYNTVHINGNSTSSACYDYSSSGESVYISFLNNNLVNHALGKALGTTYLTSDFNNLFSNGAILNGSSSDLEDWQTSYNKDLNSVSVDPYFVADTSWHILNPALNEAGTPLVEVTEDLDGDTRDAVYPDIGADEFTPAPVPLSGTYTIAGTSPDYTTIYDAVKDLTINGVNGPVTFKIATDTLEEQVTIYEIAGVSETNTITFQSATGDSSDVLITFTPVNTKQNHTIRLDGADYITFNNISVSSGEVWGWAVNLKNEATNNRFLNNRFFFDGTMTGDDDYAFIYSSGSLDTNNVFDSNLFENGSVGIYMNGSAAPDSIAGIQIKNNIFVDIVRRGVNLQKHKNLNISGNQFEILNSTYNFGLSITNSAGIIYNNFIQLETTNTGRGISVHSSRFKVLHNTVKITGNSTSLSFPFYDGSSTVRETKNNIFVNLAYGRAMNCDTTNLTSDHNLLYTNGSLLVQSSINYANLTAWQAASGRDIHSISQEPEFLSDTNLHTTDPWISNLGTPLTEVTTDIDGETRDLVHPDIGADEYEADILFSGEYTIGASGDFATFTEAVDSITQTGAIGPVIFNVEAGTYNEQLVIAAIPYVTDSIPVAFQSASGDSTDVILQFDATTSENYTIKMDSCSFITFRNMTIGALDTTHARVFEFTGGTSNNILSNNVLEGLGTTNAVVYSAGDQDNNNQFNNNLITGGKLGIQMFGESASLLESGTKITDNIFEDQFSGPILLKFNDAPFVMNNRMIHDDLIKDIWAGIYLDECSGNGSNLGLIANNIIAFNTEVMSAGIVLSGSSYQRIYYNSVNIFGATEHSRAFNQEEGGSNNIVTNNIFNNLSGGLVIYTRDVNSFSSDYNNYYSSDDRFIYYGVSGTEYYWISDLVTWQANYSKDLNSSSVDPQFVSDTNLLPANIYLDGFGTPLAEVTVDFEGNPRDPANPDIGAYEFTGCSTSGTFTIGSSGADYSTFEEAIESLQTCWAGSPIIFNVQSGTYNEQVIIPEIPGASETNTITFQSASGDSTDVILTYESTNTDTNYTVKLDGADFIRFRNLTIRATGSDYANVMEISNGASNNQFHNNRFVGVNTTNPGSTYGVLVYSPDGGALVDTNNIFNKNLFLSGSHGIYLRGDYSNPDNNNQITGNRFEDQVSYSMCLYYQDSTLVSMNEISNTFSEENYYGIYFNGINSQISKNRINISNNNSNVDGIYISGFDESKPSISYNNFVNINTTGYGNVVGINLSYCNSYYNSVNITGDNTGSYALKLPNSRSCSLKNNIFLNNAGGYVINYGDGSALNVSSDYNDLYSNGDYLALYNSTNLADMAEWTNATTFDSNSVSVDPMFVSDSDLHTQNPVLNGAGTPIAEVTDDIDGESRDAVTPDIGADEFETVIYTLGDNINTCAYDTATLDAGNEYDSYSWSNGTTTRFINVDTTGIGLDSVKLVSTVTLGGQEYKDSLWVSFHKPVALTFDIDTCEDNYIELRASGGISYHWDVFVTNPDTCCISVYISNVIQNNVVTVYDSYGCYDTDTATVVPYSKPSQPVIQFSNDSLVSSVSGTGYDWFLNSTTTGNTTQAILPQESGDYQVVVYNGGCPSDSSDSYNYIVGIKDLAGNLEITLYPNPTNGKLFISFEKRFSNLMVSVINLEGKIVLSRLLKDIPEGYITELDLGEIPSGLYFVKFTNKEISRTARIIIR